MRNGSIVFFLMVLECDGRLAGSSVELDTRELFELLSKGKKENERRSVVSLCRMFGQLAIACRRRGGDDELRLATTIES